MKYSLLLLLMVVCFQGMTQNRLYEPWIGRSTGKLPALAYGLGEDRLGGAKLGYIDSNIALRVMDTVKGMYLVQLSKFHQAYIEQQYVKTDSLNKLKPWYVTGSISAKGDSAYDYINVIIDEKLPYKSWMEINPSKIVVDIFGVQSNTNWRSSSWFTLLQRMIERLLKAIGSLIRQLHPEMIMIFQNRLSMNCPRHIVLMKTDFTQLAIH